MTKTGSKKNIQCKSVFFNVYLLASPRKAKGKVRRQEREGERELPFFDSLPH